MQDSNTCIAKEIIHFTSAIIIDIKCSFSISFKVVICILV